MLDIIAGHDFRATSRRFARRTRDFPLLSFPNCRQFGNCETVAVVYQKICYQPLRSNPKGARECGGSFLVAMKDGERGGNRTFNLLMKGSCTSAGSSRRSAYVINDLPRT
jgi:hypothetical protein